MSKQRDHEVMEKRRVEAAKLFKEGKGASEVARILGVKRQSAHGWLQAWRQKGVKGLASKGAAGPKERLSEKEKADLVAALVKGPEAFGYENALWTLPRVAHLIKERTGQRYHPGHVWRLLRGLGFSCQQPTRRAIERNEAAIQQWKKAEWPALKKKRREKGARSSSSTKAG